MTVSRGIYRQWEKTGEKVCLKCHVSKPVDQFYWSKRPNGGGHPHSYCKPCHIRHGTLKRAAQPVSHKRRMTRKKWLLARFGITPDDYERMFREQNGLCAICGKPESFTNRILAVDHCHEKNKVRALLCGKCNTVGIGMLQESLPLMQKAMEYLRKHGATWTIPPGG